MWEQLWSEARYDFRLSDTEFGKLTPRQFSLLRKRRQLEHERQELLCGIIASNIVNFSMAHPKEPVCPADFMPSRVSSKRDEDEFVRLHHSIVNQHTLKQGTTRING